MTVISRLPEPVHQEWDWQLRAACRGVDERLALLGPVTRRGR
ncbi:hypothetical protein [Kitasatospora sp. NPDC093679]